VLLRGINVGGNNIVPMKELKPLLTSSGFEGVSTYIQSGNIVLSASQPPSGDIAELIEREFGFRPAILTLTEAAFRQAELNNPYQGEEGKAVHFYFCQGVVNLDAERLQSLAAESERYQLIGDVFYLHAPQGIGRSKLVAKL